MPLPEHLNDSQLVNAYEAQRSIRLALDKQLAEAKAGEEAFAIELQRRMLKGRANALASENRIVKLHTNEVGAAKDWSKVHAHILATGEFDLLQHRLSNEALRARWANGVEVPGVEKFKQYSLTIGKL